MGRLKRNLSWQCIQSSCPHLWTSWWVLGQVTALKMVQHIFTSYRVIDKIDLEENMVNMMGLYNPTEPLVRLIDELENGWEFAILGWQAIADTMMVSKGITLLAQTANFNEYIWEWLRQSNEIKIWASLKSWFHRAHREQISAVITTGKGIYNAAVNNKYIVPPPPPEDHYQAIEWFETIVHGKKNQSYRLELPTQANAVFTSSNSSVISQLAQSTVTINVIQAQLKTLSETSTDTTITERKFYCWGCGCNFTHGIKPWSAKKTGHKKRNSTRNDFGGVKRVVNDG